MINLKELYIDVDNNTPLAELIEQLTLIQKAYIHIPLRLSAHIDIALEPIPEWENKKQEEQ